MTCFISQMREPLARTLSVCARTLSLEVAVFRSLAHARSVQPVLFDTSSGPPETGGMFRKGRSQVPDEDEDDAGTATVNTDWNFGLGLRWLKCCLLPELPPESFPESCVFKFSRYSQRSFLVINV